MTIEEDTKIKLISQEVGENNVKPPIRKPKKHITPDFESYEQKLRIRSGAINHTQQEDKQPEPSKMKESSIWGKIIKALPLPLIGYLTALIAPKKIEAKNNPDTHTKDISSKFEGSSVEKASNKKDHSHTK